MTLDTKKILLSILSVIALSGYCFGQTTPNLEKKINKKKMEAWVDSVFNSLTPDQRIGQLITAITTGENTEANKKKLLGYVTNQHVNGIIFLKGTPVNQATLTNYLTKNAKTPLFISIDGEWGLSMRLENTTRFPKNMMLGAIQEDSLLYYFGKEMARQCKIMGIHINYAPVLDVNSNPQNPVIGIRSFGEDQKHISQLANMYSKGLEDGGVLSVSKHFPGHGDTSEDSHYTLPLVNRSLEQLENIDLYPFREYIKNGSGGVMIGHLNIPSLDTTGVPSSMSKPIITDLLKEKLGFSGLIFTDGLAMEGIKNEPNMSVRLLKAGNDILLGPVSPEREFNAIKKAIQNKELSEELVNEKCKKILKWKYILGATDKPVIKTSNLSDTLNTPYAEWLSRKLNEKAITIVKNENSLLPLKSLDKRNIAVISLGAGKGNTFQRTLKLYDNVAQFTASNVNELNQLKSQLSKYNTVIFAVHNNKSFSDAAIESLITGKKGILVFFTTPYQMKKYAASIKSAEEVYVAYEDTPFANEYAGQAIFGGNDVTGKLPVTVEGLFKVGAGLKTEKTRLSYNMPEDVGMSSEKLANIDKIVTEGLNEKAYPGCQVVVAKNGVIVYNKAFGKYSYTSTKEVTDESIYDIASMTKATATVPALMKLYDEKKFLLNDKISKHLPILKNTDKSDITIKQALLHETGLPSFLPYYMPAIDKNSYEGKLFNAKKTPLYSIEFDNTTWVRNNFKFKKDLISTTPRKDYGIKVAENFYAHNSYKDTILQLIIDAKLNPSNKYHYSCLNFMLLKETVENISNTDLNQYLQKNFYDKLGAYTTTYNPLNKFEKEDIVPTEKDDFLRKQLLQGYVHDEGAAFQGGISGNAGLFSNANDIAKLCQMLLNKGIYGSERYLSNQTCRTFTITKSGTSRRGLGFDKPDIKNTRANPCSLSTPINTYGHTGFTGTSFWIDPDNQLIYIFLSNRVNEKRSNKKLNSLNIRARIQEEIYKAFK